MNIYNIRYSINFITYQRTNSSLSIFLSNLYFTCPYSIHMYANIAHKGKIKLVFQKIEQLTYIQHVHRLNGFE